SGSPHCGPRRATSPPFSADSRRRMGLSIPSVPRPISVPALARLLTATDDQTVRRLVVPRLLALGRLAPRGDRMAPARRLAFAAAMRMVDRVHRDATHRRPPAEPAIAAGLADHDVLVIGVRHRADRRPAFGAHHAHFARGHAQEGIALVAPDQLNIGSGRAGELTALAWLHLDIVDDRPG